MLFVHSFVWSDDQEVHPQPLPQRLSLRLKTQDDFEAYIVLYQSTLESDMTKAGFVIVH